MNDALLHEMLDRSLIAAEFFSDVVAQHPMATHPKFAKKVATIERKLFQLYQLVAQVDYEDEVPASKYGWSE
jgi:hypothetical protein